MYIKSSRDLKVESVRIRSAGIELLLKPTLPTFQDSSFKPLSTMRNTILLITAFWLFVYTGMAIAISYDLI